MSLRTLERAAQAQAPVFSALGDPTRLWLVGRLLDGDAQSISELTAGSQLTRQAISKHLRVLEEAGIVRNARAGRESRYELDPQPIADARAFLDRVSAQWDAALGRLRVLAEQT